MPKPCCSSRRWGAEPPSPLRGRGRISPTGQHTKLSLPKAWPEDEHGCPEQAEITIPWSRGKKTRRVISESTGVSSGFDLMLLIPDWRSKRLCSLTEGRRGARRCAKLRLSPVDGCVPPCAEGRRGRRGWGRALMPQAGGGFSCTSAAQLLGYGSAPLSFSSPPFKATLKNVSGGEKDASARKERICSHIPARRAAPLGTGGVWRSGEGTWRKPSNPFQAGPQGCTHPCQACCPQRGSHSRASISHLVTSPVPRPGCPGSPRVPLRPQLAGGPRASQPFHCTRSSLLQQKLQKNPWKLLVSAKPKLNCIHSIKFSCFKLAFFGSTLPATS